MEEETKTMESKPSFIRKAAGGCRRGFCGLRAFLNKPFFRYKLVQVYLLSFFTTYIVEGLSHYRHLPQLLHVVKHPLIFLTNMLIVSLLFIPPILFRRKAFFYTLSFILWLTVGVVDFIVLHNRVTPFNANDFKMLNDALNVVVHYFKFYEIAAVIILICIGVAGLIFAFLKFPKTKNPVNLKKTGVLALVLFLAHLGLVLGSVKVGIMKHTFPNLANAYQDYGLPYCFACSIVDKGIKKPSGYSKGSVQEVIETLPSPTPVVTETYAEKPNIIFIQLESFFDPKRIRDIKFEEDPIPNFTHLYNHYCSGLLTVPSISAGTANTEFEVLTGMNMADFGSGEYPYRTILQSSTCENLAFVLKPLGYACHAIHNNTATFYGRDVVFSNLGFDTFDSIETMSNVEMNALGWAKDKVLYREINAALNSTLGKYFIFTVSVQGHGKYPDEEILDASIPLTKLSDAYDDSTIYGLRYYTTQLNEMDAFIGSLVANLSERNEKTVLVLYGDHLPGFDFEPEDLTSGTLLQTEYVIWTNFETEVVHKDLYSYQLAAYVQDLIGLHEGLIPRLHQSHFVDEEETEEKYLEDLRVLSYDMLYGNQYCWDGVNPYSPTVLTYGFYRPDPTSMHAVYDSANDTYYLTVYGTDFTPYSYIFINGERYKDTIYVSDTELFLPRITLNDRDAVSVGVWNDGNLYRTSPAIRFRMEEYQ